MEFISTARNGRKLLVDGYAYIVDKKRGEMTYWRCDLKSQCCGRGKTINDNNFVITKEHSHPPDSRRVCSLKVINDIRIKAKHTDEVTSQILEDSLSHYPVEAIGHLPKRESLSRLIKRQRTLTNCDVICDELKTSKNEHFTLYESEDLIILATATNLNILSDNVNWFCDGSFDSAPLGFQLYTIHVSFEDNHTMPLVYCLMKSKTSLAYKCVFNTLKEHNDNLNPISITTDFEEAELNAIKDCFPKTQVYGWFFQFGQCLWRKIQSLGLQFWYNDVKNTFLIKQIQALAFVPIEHVPDAFNELISSIDNETDTILSDFLVYFESTWIGIVQGGRRRVPTFEIPMWNTEHRTKIGLPRTTNYLETWHRAFSLRIMANNPSLNKIISKIMNEQAFWEVKVEKVMSGELMPVQKKKYKDIEEKLKPVIAKYNEYPRLDYLKAIAQII